MARIPLPLLPTPIRWSLVAVVAIGIFVASLLTGPPGPADPGPFWDKQLHFAAYLALGLSLAYATASRGLEPDRRWALVLGAAILYGLGIELLQLTLPDRTFSYGDILANAIGAGLTVAWIPLESVARYVPVGDE